MAKKNTQKLSGPNRAWGICGFTSALAGLYETDKTLKSRFDKALHGSDFRLRLLAEMKTYLNFLRADESPLLKKIVDYTRTFDGYDKFTIEAFIEEINQAVTGKMPKDYGIALPPEVVVDYLKRMWERKTPKVEDGDGASAKNVMLGMFDKAKAKGGTLQHWVFKVDDANTYNWGKKKSLADVVAECAKVDAGVIGCYITI